MAATRNLADRLRWWRRINGRLEAWQLRRLGWTITTVAFRLPNLVLTTTGRRTGRTRATPLTYLRDGDDLLVAGGAVGQTSTPDWVANLRHTADAVVWVDRHRVEVVADEVTGPERDELWARFKATWPRLTSYETKTPRTIPVFRLRPRA